MLNRLLNDLNSHTMPFTVHYITSDADMITFYGKDDYSVHVDDRKQDFTIEGDSDTHLRLVNVENYSIEIEDSQPDEKIYTLTHTPAEVVFTFLII